MSGLTIGTVVKLNNNPTVAELKKAKAEALDVICQGIRKAAKTHDDFFIVKSFSENTTVGVKICLPTVEQDVDY